MDSKHVAALFVAFVLWASWFFRYDISDYGGFTLDRWTGSVIYPSAADKYKLSEATTRAEWVARQSQPAEAPAAGAPTTSGLARFTDGDPNEPLQRRKPGMFDEFEQDAR